MSRQVFVLEDARRARVAELFVAELLDRVPVLFLVAPAVPDRLLELPDAEPEPVVREPARDFVDREPAALELDGRAEREFEAPLARVLALPEPPALLARVPPALLLARAARVFAARLAEALRESELRLRVRAAFLAASSRLAGPPVARSSRVSAKERRSLAVLRSALGAVPPASFAMVAASATVRATFLRTPPARTAL